MRLQRLFTTFALLYWKQCQSLTIPAGLTSFSFGINLQFNTTPITPPSSQLDAASPLILYRPNSLAIPIAFKCDTEILRRGFQPLNGLPFYKTALMYFFVLAFLKQDAPIPDWRTWEVEDSDVRIAAKTTQVRYAIWGLWRGIRFGETDRGFFPMINKMTYNGQDVGQVNVAAKRAVTELLGSEELTAESSSGTLQDIFLNMTIRNPVEALGGRMKPALTSPEYEYKVIPRGRKITLKHLFQTTIETLVVGSEEGTETRFPGWTQPGFYFVGVRDGKMQSLMTYEDLMRAMAHTAALQSDANFFNEVDIEIWKDKVLIGQGQLRNP